MTPSTVSMTLIQESYDPDGRFNEYIFSNNVLISVKPALKLIYNQLVKLPSFIEAGSKKIIMVHGIHGNKDFSLHHNVLITNYTSFEEYYDSIEDIISLRYDEGYDMDVIETFRVRIWNMDNIENKSIKITKISRSVLTNPVHTQKRHIHQITPLKTSGKNINSFLTMDIETMSDNNNTQIPVLISLYGCDMSKYFVLRPRADLSSYHPRWGWRRIIKI